MSAGPEMPSLRLLESPEQDDVQEVRSKSLIDELKDAGVIFR